MTRIETNLKLETDMDFAWYEDMGCSVTVCDAECKIIYMNRRARETFAKYGDLIGKDLMACHSPRSQEIIRRLLREGSTNSYTITKQGINKLIHQTAWRKESGEVGGLVEFSIILPSDMPHYDRG